MAYANSTRSVQLGFADRFGSLFSGLKLALQQRRIYNQTVHELRTLSDRDLADLGIHRAMITDVAKEAAYGK